MVAVFNIARQISEDAAYFGGWSILESGVVAIDCDFDVHIFVG